MKLHPRSYLGSSRIRPFILWAPLIWGILSLAGCGAAPLDTPVGGGGGGGGGGVGVGDGVGDAPEPSVAAESPIDVDRLLAAMTLEEKAGQLFMAWILSSEGRSAKRHALLTQIRAGLLGGVVLSTGKMAEARDLIVELQASAPRVAGRQIPLLIAGDFENGLTLRLKDAPHLGNAMLLGASGSADLAHRVGLATGVSGRALGFHICFAPVLDVNNNPDNPIINVRSLGGDPAAVSRLGTALVRGIQENMIATAKHFPGHGDVSADSHLVLPTVAVPRDRLDAVELPPFRAAIDAGIGAVMTAHLEVPALDPRKNVPATCSQAVLTDLLRKDMGFEGIIVTDALEMGGIQKVMDGAAAAVHSLAAGADLLLMPPDPELARDAVVAAVRAGQVPRERLDAAVRRLLVARLRYGQSPRTSIAAARLTSRESQLALGREVARRGITLVHDRQGLVPLAGVAGGSAAPPTWTILSVADATGDTGAVLVRDLRAAGIAVDHRTLHPKSDPKHIASALRAATAATHLLVGLHIKVRAFTGKIGVPPELRGVLEVLDEHPRAVAVSFGNPYLVREFPRASTYVCAFDQGPIIESAVADALTARAPITGRLPISIPGVAGLNTGESRFGAAIDSALTERLQTVLEQQIGLGAFPGAVAMVTRGGLVIAKVAAGHHTYDDNSARVTVDTLYDLASLTKICATLPAMAVLLHRGTIALDDKLSKWVPEFQGELKDSVTLRHVMVHSAGLPAFKRLFSQGVKGKRSYIEASARLALDYEPGAKKVYSDHGLMLLMAVVEKASGKSLDQFLAEEVYPKLGVRARFGRAGVPLAAAPTEVDAWRGRLVQGEVHDENAFAMGGVSGHAGLFGRAADVARIGNMFLSGGGGLISPELAKKLATRDDMVAGSTRALLWDTFRAGGSGGSKLSPDSYGHTGFTGTSIWCDPQRDLCIVLLTNRVHPTRNNNKIRAARRRLHDTIIELTK